MVQVIPRLDVGGEIGKGLGEGLGAVAGMQIGKGILSRNLQSFREKVTDPETGQLRQDVSPLDLMEGVMQATYGIRGGPEFGQKAFEELMRERARTAPTPPDVTERMPLPGQGTFSKFMAEEIVGPLADGQDPGQITEEIFRQQTGIDPKSLETKEQIEAFRGQPFLADPDQRMQIASKWAKQTGGSLQDGLALYDDYVNQIRQKWDQTLDQQERNLQLETRAEARLNAAYDKLGIDAKQLGDIEANLANQQRQLIKEGATAGESAELIAKRAQSYLKQKAALNTLAPATWLGSPGKNWTESLEAIRSSFADVGALPELEQRLRDETGVGAGQYFSAATTYPLTEELEKGLEKIPSLAKVGGAMSLTAGQPQVKEAAKYTERAKEVIKKGWGKNDSVLTLKSALYEKFRDNEVADSIISDLVEGGDIQLTDRQREQLVESKDPIGAPSLGDVFLGIMGASEKRKGWISRLFTSMKGAARQ